MNTFPNFKQLMPDETFLFECQNCGDCCRNINGSVMIESLDLFKIARYMNLEITEAAEKYTKMVKISWGVPILVLETKSPDNSCVFLKSDKCGIQPVKPRTCRLYPLSVGPDNENEKNFIFLKLQEREFHYSGQGHVAKRWVADNMNSESCDYIITEYRLLRELGKILRCIPSPLERDVMEHMLLFRYFLFDTGKDFMKQYIRNMTQLKTELEKLTK